MPDIELDPTPSPREEAEDFSNPDDVRKRAEVRTIIESNLDLRLNRKIVSLIDAREEAPKRPAKYQKAK